LKNRQFNTFIIMRKLTAIFSLAACLALTATSSFGQSQVSFFTRDFVGDAAGDSHIIFNTDMITRAAGPNIVAQIVIGATGGTLESIGAPVALNTVASGNPGFIFSGAVAVTQNVGDMVDYQIRAWDITTGATFAGATTRGISNIETVTLVGAPSAPVDLNTFSSFNLEVVPEPSTVALGVIGGLALLMRRRK
jgi:hypothetical protein